MEVQLLITANIQDELTGALIGLARAVDGHKPTEKIDLLMMEGLFTTVANVSFDDKSIKVLIDEINVIKEELNPKCDSCSDACGRNDNYNMAELWNDNENIRSLKSLILLGVRGMAVYAYHAYILGYTDKDVTDFLYKAMFTIGSDLNTDELLPIVMETGTVNLKCMELLDKANTDTYFSLRKISF